jgi:hypothetical protein
MVWRTHKAQKPLSERLLALLGKAPGTVNELAALMRKPRRHIHAALCQLRRQGRAAVVGSKVEDSLHPKLGLCHRKVCVWGLPQ